MSTAKTELLPPLKNQMGLKPSTPDQSKRASTPNSLTRAGSAPEFPKFKEPARNFSPRTKVPPIAAPIQHPLSEENEFDDSTVDVKGKDRHKYFYQPEENYKSYVEAKTKPTKPAETVPIRQLESSEQIREPQEDSSTRDAEVQTMYRESEAQTLPYSPDYVLKGITESELVLLAEMGLGYGKGLPIGQEQLELIERARQKKKWESALPPMDNPETLDLRRKMMEEQEYLEAEYRAQEIKRIQEARLDMMRQALRTQEQEREMHNMGKIDSITQRFVDHKNTTINKLEERKILMMRKLTKDKEKFMNNKSSKRDIIEDYGNFGSRVYAPILREGRAKRNFVMDEIPLPLTAEAPEIQKIEKLINKAPKTASENPRPKTTTERRELELSAQLEIYEKTLQEAKVKKTEKLGKPSVAEKIEKPPPRPPTPTNDGPSVEEEEEENAIILLQQLIRGRAIQNLMYEGKMRRVELIEELKGMENRHMTDQERQNELARMAELGDEEVMEEDRFVDSVLQEMFSDVIGRALDFLANELVRNEEERKIAAIVEIAEHTRRTRELEETVRRKAEEDIRRKDNARYLRIMEIHHRTATTFLDDIFEDATRSITQRKEQAEMKQRAQEEIRLQSMDSDPNTVINDLIFGYLFPFVEKEANSEQAILDGSKYTKAAKDVLDSLIPLIERQLSQF